MEGAIVSLRAAAALSVSPTPHFLILLSKQRFLPFYSKLPLTTSSFLKPKLPSFPTALPRRPTCAFHPHIDHGALLQDTGATALVAASAYFLILFFDHLTKRNLIEQKLSRKLVHILSGPLFMASWPLYSSSVQARYFAAIVPFTNCLRLLIYGLSMASDKGLVKSMTREGKPKELLRGPLYYVLVLMFCVLIFWRESPVGAVSLGMMCGGDGFADIMGRRFGALKLPYNQQKSWAGSICMCLFGFTVSIGILYYYSVLGYLQLHWISTVEKVAVVSFFATLVESLPISDVIDDNISVPLSSMLLASLFFRHGPPT